MSLELNGSQCDCVDCHVLRYDMAVDAVNEAKVRLADAFMEADELLDVVVSGDDWNAIQFYTAALQKRNALTKEVRRLQALANTALDTLIARKREQDGEKHG